MSDPQPIGDKASSRPTLVSLGAGESQCLVIEKAKSLGYDVIGIDRDPEAPGFERCDRSIVLSTHEAQPILDALDEQSPAQIVGVLNRSTGPSAVTAAHITNHLGLPGMSVQAAGCLLYKNQLHTAARDHGILTPLITTASSIDEVAIEELKFPCIVKPGLSMVGKGGITIAKAQDQFESAFNTALRQSENGTVNIERYLDGGDLTLMTVATNGKLVPIALFDEFNVHDRNGHIRPFGYSVPSIHTDSDIEVEALKVADELMRLFEIETSPFTVCFRIDRGQLYLIEVHTDLGGDLILDELLPASAGDDLLSEIIKMIAGNSQSFPSFNLRPTLITYDLDENLARGQRAELIHARDSRTLYAKAEAVLSLSPN